MMQANVELPAHVEPAGSQHGMVGLHRTALKTLPRAERAEILLVLRACGEATDHVMGLLMQESLPAEK